MASASQAFPSVSTTVRQSGRRTTLIVLTYIALATSGLLFCFPFFWTILTSLKTGQETQLVPPTVFPVVFQWHNYVTVWLTEPVALWLTNSMIIIIASLPGALITSTVVAYSFARFDFPGRNFLFMVMLSTLMLPAEVTLIPQYIIFQKYFHWINTYWPLIVPSWTGGGAFLIFLMRQFLMTIPRDLDDAARVDGANSFQILWRILVPLCRPALATVAILQFLAQWNDFFAPFIYLNSQRLFTMSLGLRYFQTLPETVGEPKTHLLMAATLIMAAPAILLFFSFQRYFVRGIVLTGIKG